jgi:hypothetical protein
MLPSFKLLPVLVCALLAAAPARAEEAWRHQIRADLGIASAVGWGGLTYTYAATPDLWLEGGVGKGITGTQLSLMAKLAFPVGRSGTSWVIAGAGPSVSLKRLGPGDVGVVLHSDGAAAWVNADFGYQYRAPFGITFYIAAGLAGGLYSNYLINTGIFNPRYRGLEGLVAPQARLGIGYSF